MGISPLAILAGLGAGAESLGSDINQRNVLEQAKQRQLANDLVENQLKRAQIAHLQSQSEGQWGNAFPGEDQEGPGMFQQHKTTGEVRRVRPTASLANLHPSVIPQGTAAQAPPVPGDSQDMTGAMEQPPQGVQTPQQPSSSGTLKPYVKPPPPIVIDRGKSEAEIPGTLAWIAAQRAKAKIQAEFRPPAASTNVYLPSVDPATGKTVYSVGQSKGAPNIQSTETEKPTGTGGGGQSLSTEDRAKMLNQAKLDHQVMTDYENKVLSSGKTPGTLAGLAGATTAAHGGVANNMLGILGNQATGAIDPEYQRYITAQRSYGRVMGNLQSKRYTDNQAEIERSISGLQGNDLKGTIEYKQRLREASLADPTVHPAQGGGRGGANPAQHAGTTRAQQLWDAAVAKHGKDKVLAEFGPRPE